MKIACALFAGLILNFSLPAAADNRVIIIHPDQSDRYSEVELRDRVYRLEQAVEQLQDKVFQLASAKNEAEEKSKWVTCFIETTFKGTASDTAPTETAAKVGALKKCHDLDAGLDCREKNVKCGK